MDTKISNKRADILAWKTFHEAMTIAEWDFKKARKVYREAKTTALQALEEALANSRK